MHVNILILIVYTSNYQLNTILYENMRNDFAKSFLVYPKPLNKTPIYPLPNRCRSHILKKRSLIE